MRTNKPKILEDKKTQNQHFRIEPLSQYPGVLCECGTKWFIAFGDLYAAGIAPGALPRPYPVSTQMLVNYMQTYLIICIVLIFENESVSSLQEIHMHQELTTEVLLIVTPSIPHHHLLQVPGARILLPRT